MNEEKYRDHSQHRDFIWHTRRERAVLEIGLNVTIDLRSNAIELEVRRATWLARAGLADYESLQRSGYSSTMAISTACCACSLRTDEPCRAGRRWPQRSLGRRMVHQERESARYVEAIEKHDRFSASARR